MLMEVVATHPAPIYVNHEIIHNSFVVKMFERKGVIFEPDLDNIPEWSLIVISAHGTGPSYFEKLRVRNMRWCDATCPLVEKVHREARDLIARDYHILYIGKEWHQEAVWVMDEGEKYFTLIESEEDLEKIVNRKSWVVNQKLALLTQTTLSVDDTAALTEKIVEKYPDILLPRSADICYATTNRQHAVKELAQKVDLVLVVGSKNSSNSSKLRHVAEAIGKRAYLIDSQEDIDMVWFEWVSSLWVTAWASGPEELVDGVVRYLEELGWEFIAELRVVEEKVDFPYTLKIQQ
jgi:4-hydroxy-3-methylbut-2-en-1-yl diphosphate reductase